MLVLDRHPARRLQLVQSHLPALIEEADLLPVDQNLHLEAAQVVGHRVASNEATA